MLQGRNEDDCASKWEQGFCEIHRHKNFRIDEMIDKNGHVPPQSKIEGIKIWFRDGFDKHRMIINRIGFWFRSEALCGNFAALFSTKKKD